MRKTHQLLNYELATTSHAYENECLNLHHIKNVGKKICTTECTEYVGYAYQ